MKNYIARGQNAWTVSTDKDDALLRLVSRIGSLEGITLMSTEGDWEISHMDGGVSSDKPIVVETVELGDLQELASSTVCRARRLLEAMEEVTDRNYYVPRRAIEQAEEFLDGVEDWEDPRWKQVLIGKEVEESTTEG